jgi:hypothetical protein
MAAYSKKVTKENTMTSPSSPLSSKTLVSNLRTWVDMANADADHPIYTAQLCKQAAEKIEHLEARLSDAERALAVERDIATRRDIECAELQRRLAHEPSMCVLCGKPESDHKQDVHCLAEPPSVSLSVYESAVNGRRDFREAYKQARDLLNRFVAAWEGNGENMDRLCELARTGATTEPPVVNQQEIPDGWALVPREADPYIISLIPSLTHQQAIDFYRGLVARAELSRGAAIRVRAWSCHAESAGPRRCAQWCKEPGLCPAAYEITYRPALTKSEDRSDG